MKTLLYTSRASHQKNEALVPEDLIKILNQSRISNARHGISGVLAYRAGHYIQALEGPSEAVERLYTNIQQDARHSSVSLLYKGEVSLRRLGALPMRLMSSNDDRAFINYVNANFRDGSEQSKRCLHKLGRFFNLKDFDNSKASEDCLSSYEGKKLVLRKWPRFDIVEPTQAAVTLCAYLLKGPVEYEQVIACHTFPDQIQLDHFLTELEDARLLGVTAPSAEHSVKVDSISKKMATPFYKKMRRFLRLAS